MRQSNQKSRSRGRNRKPQNPMSRNFESNGPDVKIRGNASHIADKYTTLARDALSNGDRVIAENYLQHAEHYNRIVAAAQQQSEARAAEMAEKRQVEPDSQNSEETVHESVDEEATTANANGADETGNSDSSISNGDATPKERKPGRTKRPRKQSANEASEKEGNTSEKPAKEPKVAVEAISDDAAKLPGSILGGMVAEEG